MKDTLKFLAGFILLLGYLAHYYSVSAIRSALGLPPSDSEEDAS